MSSLFSFLLFVVTSLACVYFFASQPPPKATLYSSMFANVSLIIYAFCLLCLLGKRSSKNRKRDTSSIVYISDSDYFVFFEYYDVGDLTLQIAVACACCWEDMSEDQKESYRFDLRDYVIFLIGSDGKVVDYEIGFETELPSNDCKDFVLMKRRIESGWDHFLRYGVQRYD